MKLDVVYEDKEIIVCYKPSGVATQTASLSSPDVVSLIKNYLAKQTKEKLVPPDFCLLSSQVLNFGQSGFLCPFSLHQKHQTVLLKLSDFGPPTKRF